MADQDDTFEQGKQALRDIKETLRAGGEDVAAEAGVAAADVRETAADMAMEAELAAERTRVRAEAAAASAGVALDDAGEIAAETARKTFRSKVAPIGADLMETAEERIRDKPLQAVGIAALVGLFMGLVLRGSRP